LFLPGGDKILPA